MKKISVIMLVMLLAMTFVFANGAEEDKKATVGYVDEVIKQIEDEVTARISGDTALQKNIDDVTRLFDTDATLQANIDSVSSDINKNVDAAYSLYKKTISDFETKINANESALKDEKTARTKAEATLQKSIDAVSSEVKKAVSQVSSTYDQAVKEFNSVIKSAEKTLGDAKTAITAEYKKADAELQKNVDAATADYKKADAALQKNVDTVAADYKKADTTLQKNIDAVAADYKKADAEIQKNIDSLNNRIENVNDGKDQRIDTVIVFMVIFAVLIVGGYVLGYLYIKKNRK